MKRNKVKRDRIILDAIVLRTHKAGMFDLQLLEGKVNIIAVLSGKLRENFIKIVAGDYVKVEVSEYDMTKGRIISREKYVQ